MFIAEEKEQKLLKELKAYKAVAVAYSGGVDSTYLSDCANDVLGKKALIVIADSPSIPRSELKEAINLSNNRGWNLLTIKTDEYKNKEYLANKGMRCFHCKNTLFKTITDVINQKEDTKIIYGAVEDDKKDNRPGVKAAEKYGVLAPLQNVGLFKSEIRILSEKRKLPTASKASFACLGSRFPTGMEIDLEKMSQVEKAEEELRIRGYHQYRIRHHGDICRIEIMPEDFEKILKEKDELIKIFKKIGYRFITLDLSGFSSGSTA